MDRFWRTTIQIQNLNPEVVLHSMLFALCPDKFADGLCKKPPSSMDELREWAKGYIQNSDEWNGPFKNEIPYPDRGNCNRQGWPKASMTVLCREPEGITISFYQGACHASPHSNWRHSCHECGWKVSNPRPVLNPRLDHLPSNSGWWIWHRSARWNLRQRPKTHQRAC